MLVGDEGLVIPMAVLGILFAALSALAWGGSEFLGGMQSKRNRVLTVLFLSGVGSVLVGVVILLVRGIPLPSDSTVWMAVPAGVVGFVALGLIYKAIAIGPAIAVLPTATCATVLPVLWGFVTGEPFSLLSGLFCAVALAGSLVASGVSEFGKLDADERQRLRRSLPLALVAALFVGAYFVFTKESSEADPFWAVTIARSVDLLSVLLVMLVVFIVRRPPRDVVSGRALLVAAAAGVTDILAELFYALSTTMTSIGVASVISSLYPVATILLALIFWGEKPSRVQTVGLCVTLAAVAVLSFA